MIASKSHGHELKKMASDIPCSVSPTCYTHATYQGSWMQKVGKTDKAVRVTRGMCKRHAIQFAERYGVEIEP